MSRIMSLRASSLFSSKYTNTARIGLDSSRFLAIMQYLHDRLEKTVTDIFVNHKYDFFPKTH